MSGGGETSVRRAYRAVFTLRYPTGRAPSSRRVHRNNRSSINRRLCPRRTQETRWSSSNEFVGVGRACLKIGSFFRRSKFQEHHFGIKTAVVTTSRMFLRVFWYKTEMKSPRHLISLFSCLCEVYSFCDFKKSYKTPSKGVVLFDLHDSRFSSDKGQRRYRSRGEYFYPKSMGVLP